MIKGSVDADYSHFYLHLGEQGAALECDTGLTFSSDENQVVLITARQFGDIAVRVAIEERMPLVDPAWDAAVEFSVRVGEEPAVSGWGGEGWIPLPLSTGAVVRVRYVVVDGQKAADRWHEGVEWTSETYLLQMWPSEMADARVIASTSPWSHYWTFGTDTPSVTDQFVHLAPDDGVVAVVDEALRRHPDVAERIRGGDERFRSGIIRYVQDLTSAHARGNLESRRAATAWSGNPDAVERLIDERARRTQAG